MNYKTEGMSTFPKRQLANILIFSKMATLGDTLMALSHASDTLTREMDAAGYSQYAFGPDDSLADFSFLSTEGEIARMELISAAERVLLLARGPQGSLSEFRQTVSEQCSACLRSYCVCGPTLFTPGTCHGHYPCARRTANP